MRATRSYCNCKQMDGDKTGTRGRAGSCSESPPRGPLNPTSVGLSRMWCGAPAGPDSRLHLSEMETCRLEEVDQRTVSASLGTVLEMFLNGPSHTLAAGCLPSVPPPQVCGHDGPSRLRRIDRKSKTIDLGGSPCLGASLLPNDACAVQF